MKGALVQFSAPLLVPIPNIIIFQYNPETLSRSLTPYVPPAMTAGAEGEAGMESGAPPAPADLQPFDPTETFTLSLLVDSTDALETPESHPVAVVTGVADRIAAMEMLLYPAGDSLLGGLLSSAAGSLSAGGAGGAASDAPDPRRTVPTVLFVWGPGRIVPVRLTSFSVEELQYNQLLYPDRAKVSLGLRVVTSAELRAIQPGKTEYELAAFAYDFTRGQKEILALANVANTVESALGMLPF